MLLGARLLPAILLRPVIPIVNAVDIFFAEWPFMSCCGVATVIYSRDGAMDTDDPLPWLRLRVVVKEEGSIVYTSRIRRLSIFAVPLQ